MPMNSPGDPNFDAEELPDLRTDIETMPAKADRFMELRGLALQLLDDLAGAYQRLDVAYERLDKTAGQHGGGTVDRSTELGAYITHVTDQLGGAVAAGDDERAHRIIDRVDADGYPAAAEALAAGMANTTLAGRFAAEPGDQPERRPT